MKEFEVNYTTIVYEIAVYLHNTKDDEGTVAHNVLVHEGTPGLYEFTYELSTRFYDVYRLRLKDWSDFYFYIDKFLDDVENGKNI